MTGGDGRRRMTGQQRREQLLDIARTLFAERGFEATSIEEVANRAKVSKPIVYEHFKGKEGLYAVVVDREMQRLYDRITRALSGRHPRQLLGQAAEAFLQYIEDETHGFRILLRDAPPSTSSASGGLASLVGDVASQVGHLLADEFRKRGYEPKLAPLYSHALVGMVAQVGEWWLETRKPKRAEVAAHLVNVAWNGLGHLEREPKLAVRKAKAPAKASAKTKAAKAKTAKAARKKPKPTTTTAGRAAAAPSGA